MVTRIDRLARSIVQDIVLFDICSLGGMKYFDGVNFTVVDGIKALDFDAVNFRFALRSGALRNISPSRRSALILNSAASISSSWSGRGQG